MSNHIVLKLYILIAIVFSVIFIEFTLALYLYLFKKDTLSINNFPDQILVKKNILIIRIHSILNLFLSFIVSAILVILSLGSIYLEVIFSLISLMLLFFGIIFFHKRWNYDVDIVFDNEQREIRMKDMRVNYSEVKCLKIRSTVSSNGSYSCEIFLLLNDKKYYIGFNLSDKQKDELVKIFKTINPGLKISNKSYLF